MDGMGALPDRGNPTPDGGVVAVAVIDCGVDPGVIGGGRLLQGVNLSGEGEPHETRDDSGHGTAVAATILEVAPAARVVPVKLMDARGLLGDPEHVTRAFEWVEQRREALGIAVVCASLADRGQYASDERFRETALARVIAALRRAGVPTVAPAGNWKPFHAGHGMAWPAILREVISVGALRRGPDGLRPTRTSQRLHVLAGTVCRTTVFAEPGRPGETSGAAAVVAGRLAVLRAGAPGASVDELVESLRAGGEVAREPNGLVWQALSRPRAGE
jgi:subtilisin family serine protease